jgi:hypothetical protein
VNREMLMDAIGQLPEDILAETAKKRQRKKHHWAPLAAAAACLCLLLTLPLGGGMKAANKAEMEAPMEMAPSMDSILGDFFYAGAADSENAADMKVESEQFLAHVVEVYEGSLLVEPLEEEWERSTADRITVIIANPQECQPGDLVRIHYSGTLLESYPAQAVGVIGIERLG